MPNRFEGQIALSRMDTSIQLSLLATLQITGHQQATQLCIGHGVEQMLHNVADESSGEALAKQKCVSAQQTFAGSQASGLANRKSMILACN